MKLPSWLVVLGYAGLIPFLAGPLWLTISSAPTLAADAAWFNYVALVAAFLAGTFWGYALFMAAGPEGAQGLVIGSALMLLTWVSLLLPQTAGLLVLGLVFVLLLIADFWRRDTFDDIPGYFRLRAILTAGALVAIGWRLVLM